MRKIKITFGLLVIIFVALLIYQNRAYFFAKQALSFILVPEKFQWTAPAVENVAYFGGCLVIGILIASYFGLISKFRSVKNIKQLNKTILSQVETIESLKAEIDSFKSNQYIEHNPDIATNATDQTCISSGDAAMVDESIDSKIKINENSKLPLK